MSEQLDTLLKQAGISFKGPYRPGQVCQILGISPRTFSTMVTTYERGPYGQPVNPATIESYMLFSERRVTYQALEAFLARNETYERLNAIPPNQLRFDFD